jgi:uncharacterized protein YecT (DUF1311 family)
LCDQSRFAALSVIGFLMLAAMTAQTARAQETKPPANIGAVLSYVYHYRPSYDECTSKAGTSMYGMVACTKTELAYQDVRLNKAYKTLMTKLPTKEQAKLKSDENVWIQYRDTHCPNGPNDQNSPVGEYESCMLTTTAEQATFLEATLDTL